MGARRDEGRGAVEAAELECVSREKIQRRSDPAVALGWLEGRPVG